MKTNKIAMLGIGMALYVVLGFTIKIPLIAHIQTDLGYIAFGCFLYLIGRQACVVGVVGCLLESLIFSGWIPIGWMVGQLAIGIICGIAYKKFDNILVHIVITVIAVFIGVAIIKTGIECVLYGIPLMVKFPKNLIAFVADVIPMITGYLIAKRLYPDYEKVERGKETMATDEEIKEVSMADVLNDITRAINKHGLEVVAYDTTGVFTDISIDWQLGVKAKFDVEGSEEEPDEEESGRACKYYDDRDGCIFFAQGSGKPEDMPCWRGGIK